MATFLPQGSARQYNRAPAPPPAPKPPKPPKPLSKQPKPSRSSLSLRSMRSGLTTMTSRSSSSDESKKPMLAMSSASTSSASSGSTMKTGRRGFGGWDVTPRASSSTVREVPAEEERQMKMEETPVLVVSLAQCPPPRRRQHPHPPPPPSAPVLSTHHTSTRAQLPIVPSAHLPRHPKLEDHDDEDRRVHHWVSEQCSLVGGDLGSREEAKSRHAREYGTRATLGRAATIAASTTHARPTQSHRPTVMARSPGQAHVRPQHPRLRLDTDTPSYPSTTHGHSSTPTKRTGHVHAPRNGGSNWSPSSSSVSACTDRKSVV